MNLYGGLPPVEDLSWAAAASLVLVLQGVLGHMLGHVLGDVLGDVLEDVLVHGWLIWLGWRRSLIIISYHSFQFYKISLANLSTVD